MIYLIILKDYRTFFKIFLKHPGFRPHVARTISEKVTFLVKTNYFGSKMFSGPKTDFLSKKSTKTKKLRIKKLYNKMCLTIPSLFSRYDFCFCIFAHF